MIQRRCRYFIMAVCGVAVACVVGMAIAQDLDEDGAIVSEEMLLEDAVSGSLDEDVGDLLLEDLGDDTNVDALLDEDVGTAADEPVVDDVTDAIEDAIPESAPEAPEVAVEDVEQAATPTPEADDQANEAPEQEVVAAAPEAAGNLDAASDLDLMVEGAIQDALAEGVPEPPVFEPKTAAVSAAEEPVVDEAVVEDMPAEEPVEPVEEIAVEDLPEETLPDNTADAVVAAAPEPVVAVEDEPMVAAEEVVESAAPAVVEMTAEEKAQLALNQELDVMTKQEELRRQALEAHGREVLGEAEVASKAHDYKEAERLFGEAQRYVTDRPGTEKTRGRIRMGQANNYYNWAQALQRKGEIDAARELGQRALAFKHPRAAAFLEELEKAPEKVAVEAPKAELDRAKQPDFVSKQAEIAELLRSGRQHLINGEYDRAQGKFEAVLQPRLDPQNTEAIRLIQKVAQKRYDRASMEVESTRREMMAEVRQAWNPRDYGLAEAVAKEQEDVKPANKVQEGIRDRIRLKMEKIKIPEIDFRQANIHDVVEFLQMASVDFDPTTDVPDDEKGVNIILSLGQGEQSTAATQAPADDPFATTLDQGGDDAGNQVPLITFTARYISLLEALRIVTQISNLKYRIEGTVVMVVPFNAPDGEIVVRMYDVLPAVEEKISMVSDALGDDGGNDRAGGDFISLDSSGVKAGGADWKAFFADMGVNWPDKSSIKYVRTIGKIVVANTEKNLAVFEKVLEVLNVVPSQIEIEARFVEVTQTDLDSLGFEWLLDNTWQVAQKKGQANLPASARQRIEISAAGPNGTLTGGNRFIPTGLGETATAVDNVLKIGSVLTNPELSMVLHMLQQRGHADLLSAPKVTTKSGNEATMKVVTEYIYPTEFEIKSLDNLGGGGDSAIILPDGVSPFAAEPSSFETREVGVILSVLPEVSTEGQMINLNLSPEVVSEPDWKDYGLVFGDVRVPMEQPFFKTRSINTSISIYNGATVVMGGMITEKRIDVDDRVPLLGDLPLIGRLFRSSYEHSEKRNLLIFVTARLVDPNGLPINKQEEVPLPEGMVDTSGE